MGDDVTDVSEVKSGAATLAALTNEELIARVEAMCGRSTRLMAQLLVHLGEVEARGLFRDAGYTSMFAYCMERLRMCESATWRRLHAARLCRRSARLVSLIEEGRVHLSALGMIGATITDAELDQVIDRISGKTKREVEEIVASTNPKALSVFHTLAWRDSSVSRAIPGPLDERAVRDARGEGPRGGVGTSSLERSGDAEAGHRASGAKPSDVPAKYALTVAMTGETRAKLERIVELTRHANPSGDLAIVIERAVEALLEKVEKARFGSATRKSPKRSQPVRPGYVERATRREVFERDGHQCTFVSDDGHRCSARSFLEIDHIEPRARGGDESVDNLRTRCRAHNQLYAEQVYGRDYVARRIAEKVVRKTRKQGAGTSPGRSGDASTSPGRSGARGRGETGPRDGGQTGEAEKGSGDGAA
ncbi:MAG: HNH endonuclease [Deltaproteobacteria bacterium]|nr:HNH endonuclease [Deltaproteobacteria bacterium]